MRGHRTGHRPGGDGATVLLIQRGGLLVAGHRLGGGGASLVTASCKLAIGVAPDRGWRCATLVSGDPENAKLEGNG